MGLLCRAKASQHACLGILLVWFCPVTVEAAQMGKGRHASTGDACCHGCMELPNPFWQHPSTSYSTLPSYAPIAKVQNR